ncbi:MAG: 3-oxoacyl-ACP reductase FabG [Steroidobacteraceae bacterium]|jgi:3-oxoacyl-[acyl-carrier protein] reductase|nr:3-oxoacyl-ACP reductase FabG [Steroidobacteraceae bacterium]
MNASSSPLPAAFRLDGKVALVTGASRGIGRAIALTLGAAGATVVGTATTAEGAARIGETLRAAGVQGRGLVLDVADASSCDAALADVERTEGAIGILVNNAGITRDGLLLRMKQDDWDAVLNTNLASVFRLSKGVLRGMMKAREGRIVSVASVVGLVGNAGQSNYAAAKAGIVGFTKSLAREVASRNVTCNVVAPGFVDTDMTRQLAEEQRTALAGQIPLGRLGSPEDVAYAVLYLASPAGAYVTGETISVNGGMYMP